MQHATRWQPDDDDDDDEDDVVHYGLQLLLIELRDTAWRPNMANLRLLFTCQATPTRTPPPSPPYTSLARARVQFIV